MCAASYAIFLKNMFSCAVVVVSAVLSVFSGSSSLRQSGENGTIKQLTLYVSLAGPCGIPENTGIPGFDSNTDTGIFENKIPVFFGIFV